MAVTRPQFAQAHVAVVISTAKISQRTRSLVAVQPGRVLTWNHDVPLPVGPNRSVRIRWGA